MEFTGKYTSKYSEEFGEDINILEYKSDHKIPFCCCDKCGKPIIRKMYVVQSAITDIELMYLGSDCVKKLK